MPEYEYKVVPAPKKGVKAKGVRSTEDRFALALERVMNELGAEGWEYRRVDTLPCEQRSGLTGKTTAYQNMLIFRRLFPEKKSVKSAPLTLEQPLEKPGKRNDPIFRRSGEPDNKTQEQDAQVDPENRPLSESISSFRTKNRSDMADADTAPELPGQRRTEDETTA